MVPVCSVTFFPCCFQDLPFILACSSWIMRKSEKPTRSSHFRWDTVEKIAKRTSENHCLSCFPCRHKSKGLVENLGLFLVNRYRKWKVKMYMEQRRGNELRPAGHLCFCLSPYLTHYDFFFFNAYLFYFILFYFLYEIYWQIGFHTTPSAHPKRCPPQYPSPTLSSLPPPINPQFVLSF